MKRSIRLLLCALALLAGATRVSAQSSEWQPLAGPEGGAIRSLAIAPDGAVYATVDGHALYRTIDGASSWTRVEGSASDPYSRVVATPAGTLLRTLSDSTLVRSTDRGATWTPVATRMSWAIDIVRDSSGGLVAALHAGLARSTDDGATWRPLGTALPTYVTALAIGAGDELVVGQLPSGGAVAVSTDRGATWRMTLLDDEQTPQPDALAALPDGRLLAGTAGSGLLVSDDFGATWTRLHAVPLRHYSRFVMRDDRSLVVVTSDGFFVSSDGSALAPYGPPTRRLMPSTIALLADGRIIAGTYDAGTYVADEDRWRRAATGLPPVGSTTLAVAPDGTLYATGWNYRLYSSTDRGATWIEPSADDPVSTVLAVHPDGTLFNASYDYPDGGVLRSTDRGATWTTVSAGIEGEMVASLSIGRDGAIYAGIDRGEESFFSSQSDGVFRSTDLGATWTEIGSGMERRTAASTIELADGTLVIATRRTVMRLAAGASVWEDLARESDPFGPIHDLVVDAREHLHLATGQGLKRSTDRGTTWSAVEAMAATAVTSLVVTRTGSIVAATREHGTWITDDGDAWRMLGEQAVASGFETLAVDSSGSILGAHYARGIHRLATASSAPSATRASASRLAIHPNPAEETATITFDLAAPGPVVVSVVDLHGVTVARVDAGERAAGAHRIALDLDRLAAGVYVARVESERDVATRVVVVR